MTILNTKYMKKIYYLSLLVVCNFFSCKPDPPLFTKLNQGIVDGIVQDATTLEPIPFATVILFHGQSDGSLFGCCPTSPIAETIADSTGAFHFDFEFEPGYFYTCNGAANLYYQPTLEADVDYFVLEGDNVQVLLAPMAWLKIHFTNISPASASDNFSINGFTTDGFIGENIDTLVVYSCYGNVFSLLAWALYGDTASIDSIYCPSFDTTYYEILY